MRPIPSAANPIALDGDFSWANHAALSESGFPRQRLDPVRCMPGSTKIGRSRRWLGWTQRRECKGSQCSASVQSRQCRCRMSRLALPARVHKRPNSNSAGRAMLPAVKTNACSWTAFGGQASVLGAQACCLGIPWTQGKNGLHSLTVRSTQLSLLEQRHRRRRRIAIGRQDGDLVVVELVLDVFPVRRG